MAIAIIVGGAECYSRDYDAALALIHGDVTRFLVNDQIASFDGPGIGITLHPDKLEKMRPFWLSERQRKALPPLSSIWSHRSLTGVTNTTDDWGGSSGLLACKVALQLGYKKIVLCGVPMTVEDGHFVRRQRWIASHAFRRGWERHRAELMPYVRSMSGWTKEMLGEPSQDWLGLTDHRIVMTLAKRRSR